MESEAFRKLFIGGLSLSTTEEILQEYFEHWGEVVDCIVVKDPLSGRSRGFGFLEFKQAHMIDDTQKARPHKIDGKVVETKRAMPKEDASKPEVHVTSQKIYLTGVKGNIDKSDLSDYFSRFGDVESVDLVVDRETQQLRGFAFISFNDYDPVDKITFILLMDIRTQHIDKVKTYLTRHYWANMVKMHNIKGQRCEARKALTKEELERIRTGGYDGESFRARGSSRGGISRGRGSFGEPNQRGFDRGRGSFGEPSKRGFGRNDDSMNAGSFRGRSGFASRDDMGMRGQYSARDRPRGRGVRTGFGGRDEFMHRERDQEMDYSMGESYSGWRDEGYGARDEGYGARDVGYAPRDEADYYGRQETYARDDYYSPSGYEREAGRDREYVRSQEGFGRGREPAPVVRREDYDGRREDYNYERGGEGFGARKEGFGHGSGFGSGRENVGGLHDEYDNPQMEFSRGRDRGNLAGARDAYEGPRTTFGRGRGFGRGRENVDGSRDEHEGLRTGFGRGRGFGGNKEQYTGDREDYSSSRQGFGRGQGFSSGREEFPGRQDEYRGGKVGFGPSGGYNGGRESFGRGRGFGEGQGFDADRGKESFGRGRGREFEADRDRYGGPKEGFGRGREGFSDSREGVGRVRQGFGDNYGGGRPSTDSYDYNRKAAFGGNGEGYGGGRNEFAGPREPTGGSREGFGGQREMYPDNRDTYGAGRQDVGASRDSFGGNRTGFGASGPSRDPYSGTAGGSGYGSGWESRSDPQQGFGSRADPTEGYRENPRTGFGDGRERDVSEGGYGSSYGTGRGGGPIRSSGFTGRAPGPYGGADGGGAGREGGGFGRASDYDARYPSRGGGFSGSAPGRGFDRF